MIQPHFPGIGHPNLAHTNCFISAWLASPPPPDGNDLNELLAVELLIKRRISYDSGGAKQENIESSFYSIFGDSSYGKSPDVIMGDTLQSPRCKPIAQADRILWDIKKSHLMSYCATVDASMKPAVAGLKIEYHPGHGSTINVSCDQESLLDSWLAGQNVVNKWTQETTWDRVVARHHHVIGKGKPECIYLVGTELNRAKENLFTKLVEQQVPALPEWEDVLWAEFQRSGWVVPLAGSGWQGFKLAVNRDQVLDLLCTLIKGRALPRPTSVPEEIWEVI